MPPRPPYAWPDPFGATADPGSYVPRTATEGVLVRLEMALRDGAGVVALTGPHGAGKTLLAHVLAERLDGDFQAVYVPYPKLAPEELCQWILALLGGPIAPADAEAALHERIAREIAAGFPPLVFLIDDAALAPPEALECLHAMREDSAGFLHLVLIRSDEDPLERLVPRDATLDDDVRLEEGMGAPELARYLQARLDRASVPPAHRARLEGAVELLHHRTRGNPARLHAIATEILCRAADLPRHLRAGPGN